MRLGTSLAGKGICYWSFIPSRSRVTKVLTLRQSTPPRPQPTGAVVARPGPCYVPLTHGKLRHNPLGGLSRRNPHPALLLPSPPPLPRPQPTRIAKNVPIQAHFGTLDTSFPPSRYLPLRDSMLAQGINIKLYQ